MVKSDPEKVILHAFRTIEMYLREVLELEKVAISAVFDRVHEEKLIGELLYQQLKTLKRLRNDVIHVGYRPRVGDGLIALGTLRNFYEDVGDHPVAETRKELGQTIAGSHPIAETRKELDRTCSLLVDSQRDLQPARHHWRDFQEITRRFFEEQTGLEIAEEVELELPSGRWRADLVSLDRSMVIECKSYTWTKGGNVPAAKLEHARMACARLAQTTARRKALVFQDDQVKGNSLATHFVRLNRALLGGIETWGYWNNMFERLDHSTVVNAPTLPADRA
jgi:hypothetical protein